MHASGGPAAGSRRLRRVRGRPAPRGGASTSGGRSANPASLSPARVDGYAPVRDYAAIGDGRTVALVARDGSIDWLCLPDLDSPAVFSRLLDRQQGGRFQLAPEVPYGVERRYQPGTNVLETTFRTADGTVRVTDAMTLPTVGLTPLRELVRRVEGLAGSVPLRWQLVPRFDYGRRTARLERRGPVPVATAGADALAMCSWQAGEPGIVDGAIGGRFDTQPGSSSTIALCASHQEPLVLPTRSEAEARLQATCAFWRRWTEARAYTGPWKPAVLRSALALKLLVHAPSGALAAAATTSLPESIGTERNWDYRFCWVRDSAFILNAFLQLGCAPEADSFFWWLMHASQRTHPRLQVLYRLDGGSSAPERMLPLHGYRGSVPVRVGNGAVDQFQLDIYGDLLHTAWLHAGAGRPIDRDLARRLAETAGLVCRLWDQPDAGLWEVRSGARHFTPSKMMCWVALDRAIRLAELGRLPGGDVARWRRQAAAVGEFIERRCWSETKRSYVRAADSDELDAGVLLGVLFGYAATTEARLAETVDAIRRELSDGPFVHRYAGEDGLAGTEGAFLTCSFWLVEALAVIGRRDEAAELMDQLVGLANDVGLYAEEIDPATGEFLGNIPQGLTHLALINAAATLADDNPR